MYVCLCKAVTDRQILDAVDEGALDINEIADALGVGTNCGGCREYAQELVNQGLAERLSVNAAPA